MDLIPVLLVGLLVNVAAGIVYLTIESRLRTWARERPLALAALVLGLLVVGGFGLALNQLIPNIHIRQTDIVLPRVSFSPLEACFLTSAVLLGSLLPTVLRLSSGRSEELALSNAQNLLVTGPLAPASQVAWGLVLIATARTFHRHFPVTIAMICVACLLAGQWIDLYTAARAVTRGRDAAFRWTWPQRVALLIAAVLIWSATAGAILL